MDMTITTKIQAPGMTTIEDTTVVAVEAKDIITVELPAAAVNTEVDISPAALVDQLVLYIKASAYNQTNPPTYRVGLVSNPAIVLNVPHLYMGAQDSSLPAAVDKLFLSNPHTSAVTVTIVVGRDATP